MKIELTETQVAVVLEALDLHSRIGMGQLEAVAHQLGDWDLTNEPWQVVDDFIKPMKVRVFGAMYKHGHRGITNKEVPTRCRISYEMLCVIRKRIAETDPRHPNYSLWRDDPLKVSDEPFCKILPD